MTWKGAKGPRVVSYVNKAGESKNGFLMRVKWAVWP